MNKTVYHTIVEVGCPCGNRFNLRGKNDGIIKPKNCQRCGKLAFELVVSNTGHWRVFQYDIYTARTDVSASCEFIGQNEIQLL